MKYIHCLIPYHVFHPNKTQLYRKCYCDYKITYLNNNQSGLKNLLMFAISLKVTSVRYCCSCSIYVQYSIYILHWSPSGINYHPHFAWSFGGLVQRPFVTYYAKWSDHSHDKNPHPNMKRLNTFFFEHNNVWMVDRKQWHIRWDFLVIPANLDGIRIYKHSETLNQVCTLLKWITILVRRKW